MEFMEVFKDYVPGTTTKDGKTLHQKKELWTYTEAADYVTNNDCDIIAGRLKKGYVLIDCDSAKSVNAMDSVIKHFNLKPLIFKTNRGKHYYFRYSKCSRLKAWNGITNAYGIEVDIKPGNGKKNCGIIYQNNKLRKILANPEKLGTAPDELLYPMKVGKENVIPAYDMKARNDTLFTQYRPAYIKNKYTTEQATTCVQVMDCCGYLNNGDKAPLSDEEIAQIFRDDEDTPWVVKGRSRVRKESTRPTATEVAEEIIKENKIIIIGEAFYHFEDGYYKPFKSVKDIRAIIYNKDRQADKRYRDEVLDCIQLDDRIHKKSAEHQYVCFNNGVIDISKGKLALQPHSEDIICTKKIPHNYVCWHTKEDIHRPSNVNAYNTVMDALFRWSEYDAAIIELLCEMAGCCFTDDTSLQKAFIIAGEKANGKSAFIRFLQYCIGKGNYTTIDMGELSQRFMAINLKDKLANIADDIADTHLNAQTVSIFKKLVTGDEITSERKGKDPESFNSTATLIFSCNDIPKSLDPTGALERRLIYIPFKHQFTDDEKNIDIIKVMNTEENASFFISLSIECYMRARERGYFEESTEVKRISERNKEESDTVFSWISDSYGNEEEEIQQFFHNSDVDNCYKEYKWYCEESNYKPLGKINFCKKIKNDFNYSKQRKQDGGNRKWFFVKNGQS